jgi:hypothetical protein
LTKKRDDILYLRRLHTSVRTIDVTLEETVHYKLIIKRITKTYRKNATVTKTKNQSFYIQARDMLRRNAKYIKSVCYRLYCQSMQSVRITVDVQLPVERRKRMQRENRQEYYLLCTGPLNLVYSYYDF